MATRIRKRGPVFLRVLSIARQRHTRVFNMSSERSFPGPACWLDAGSASVFSFCSRSGRRSPSPRFPFGVVHRVAPMDRGASFQRRAARARRERRGGRCALCGHPHRASGVQGRLHALPQPARHAVPPGADSGAERPRSLNCSRVECREFVMPARRVPETPRPRTWRVSIFKKKLEYVGRVQAADKASAELAAATEFKLKDHERSRLFIEEVSA